MRNTGMVGSYVKAVLDELRFIHLGWLGGVESVTRAREQMCMGLKDKTVVTYRFLLTAKDNPIKIPDNSITQSSEKRRYSSNGDDGRYKFRCRTKSYQYSQSPFVHRAD